jgi:hypothetical protein
MSILPSDKCLLVARAPEDERADRKARVRLRTVYGGSIARPAKGASQAPSASRRSIPSLEGRKRGTGAPISGLPEIGYLHLPDRLKPIWLRRQKNTGDDACAPDLILIAT